MTDFRNQAAAARQYESMSPDDAERDDDARARRADADWHKADLHDSMYGTWTIGKGRQPVISVAEGNRRYREYLAGVSK